jgi:diguanylate cyclase (GGDEF)-like protein/PAS domain S-box-containing protein
MHGPREAARLAALRRYEVLDRPVDPDLEAIAGLAALICGTPSAAINLIDLDRQWQAVVIGGTPAQSPRGDSYCNDVVATGQAIYAPDVRTDPRFRGSALTTGEVADVCTYAGSPLRTPDGHVIGALCVFDTAPHSLDPAQRRALDVLAGQVVALFELHAHARALARVTGRFTAAFEHAPIGMALLDPADRWAKVNRALVELLGLAAGDLVGMAVEETVFEGDLPEVRAALRLLRGRGAVSQRVEVRLVRADGPLVWVSLSASLVAGAIEDPTDVVVQIEDISRRRAVDEERERRATHDPLTGLPNRILLADRLGTAVERLRRGTGELSVLLLDLDRFKDVNDTHGHAFGDRLLVALAQRLRGALRASDTVVRLGGDEFVIVCEDSASRGDGPRIAHRVINLLALPLRIDGTEVCVGGSVGVASTTEPLDPDELLLRADRALYAAKAAGRGRVISAPA